MPQKPILIVFIHGFLGSAESFLEFPNHLKSFLTLKGLDVEVLNFEYETKGSNSRQVQKLMDFLILHGSSAKYHGVYLAGHSMGGIMAADAYNYLYQVHYKYQDDSYYTAIGMLYLNSQLFLTCSKERVHT
jgi:triacylglycerol esterase/lipase EstA (alpha/beta hydrolase family)